MKEYVYTHIVDEKGQPVRKWMTDEEYEETEKQIQAHIDVLNRSAKVQSEQFMKHFPEGISASNET